MFLFLVVPSIVPRFYLTSSSSFVRLRNWHLTPVDSTANASLSRFFVCSSVHESKRYREYHVQMKEKTELGQPGIMDTTRLNHEGLFFSFRCQCTYFTVTAELHPSCTCLWWDTDIQKATVDGMSGSCFSTQRGV